MRAYWYIMLTMTKAGWLNTWDFQWSYSHFINHGLAIYPMVNLVTNIGFDADATNTKQHSTVASVKAGEMIWPLHHPKEVIENIALTNIVEKKFYMNIIAFFGMMRQYVKWSLNKVIR